MSYQVLITRQAEADLDAIMPFHRNRVLDALEAHLVHMPKQESRSRIKRLKALDSPEYRLRVDDFRVFYDVDESEQTVTVLRVLNKAAAIKSGNNGECAMRVIELSGLDSEMRRQLLTAVKDPVLITDQNHPLLVVRSLLDDELADEMIAEHPGFRESIRQARQQKADGQTIRLAELRAKYAVEDIEAA